MVAPKKFKRAKHITAPPNCVCVCNFIAMYDHISTYKIDIKIPTRHTLFFSFSNHNRCPCCLICKGHDLDSWNHGFSPNYTRK